MTTMGTVNEDSWLGRWMIELAQDLKEQLKFDGYEDVETRPTQGPIVYVTIQGAAEDTTVARQAREQIEPIMRASIKKNAKGFDGMEPYIRAVNKHGDLMMSCEMMFPKDLGREDWDGRHSCRPDEERESHNEPRRMSILRPKRSSPSCPNGGLPLPSMQRGLLRGRQVLCAPTSAQGGLEAGPQGGPKGGKTRGKGVADALDEEYSGSLPPTKG
jgi:hypothetical protein